MTSADGFALATTDGAEAVGLGDTVGSLEVGKRADIVVHDATRLELTPRGTDLVRQLIWAADGRSVVDVVVDGRVVVRDGRVVTGGPEDDRPSRGGAFLPVVVRER